MLTGDTPFDGQTPQRTFNNVLNKDPRFPRDVHPQVGKG
jgi:hypothetical protein